jgi:two-component system, NtrC family, response regulator
MPGTGNSTDKLQALRDRMALASTPVERVKATLALAEELWLSDPVAAQPLLEQAMTEAEPAGQPKTCGRAAYMLGELLHRAGDIEGATRCVETVFRIADATSDLHARMMGLSLRGIIHRERGELQPARDCFKELLEVSRQIRSERGERIALNQLAGVYGLHGELDEALAHYRLSLEADSKAGDVQSTAVSLYNIGWTLSAMGRWAEATESYHRSIALCEEHGFYDPLDSARIGLGELSLKRSDYEHAAIMFRAVVDEERGKQHSGPVYRDALSDLGLAHFRNGDLAQAEEALDEAARLSEAAGDRRILATVCCRRAELALARGRLDAAEDLLAQAERHAADLKLPKEQGEALRARALLCAARGDWAQAFVLFTRSEVVLGPLGDTFELARTRLHYGRELLEVNRSKEARPKLQAAAQTFRRLAVVAEAEEANRLLYRIEMRADRNAALVQGLLSIAALDLAPERFIERALTLLCDNMQFAHGAVVVKGRQVALRGNPNLPVMTGREAAEQTDLALFLPVRQEGREVGVVWLERQAPLAVRAELEELKLVSSTLAPALAKLEELGEIETGSTASIPGLRFRGVVGRNPEVLEVLRLVARTAAPGVPVLICGESGTGKELVARALHESSPRADKPFVTVNCAAVPDSLLEAEFFGVEPRAATGVDARPGKFEMAGKGTIFLDEIGDMSTALQAKLLRAIEERTVMRVGGTKETRLEARVVAATNMDLDMREREGLFRRDLLFRLNTVQLVLPPLRRRREDVPILTQYFITRSAHEYDRPMRKASADVLALFAGFSWPGNIRQLQHVVERAVIMGSGDTLQVVDLPLELRKSQPVPTPAAAVLTRAEQRLAADQSVRAMLLDALGRANGNVPAAAKLSGYSRAQFYRLLRKHGIRT